MAKPLSLRLDHHSGEPIYRQILEQVKFAIASGRLPPGERLPSIRALAGQLKINPRTVVKAYEELEHAGLAVMRQGQGVYVRESGGGVPAAARRKALQQMAERMLAEAARLGASGDEVYAAIEAAAEQMNLQPTEEKP
ncbi:MAG: GntR family transcriptional regulator [Phycisphaeraceae bacterium]